MRSLMQRGKILEKKWHKDAINRIGKESDTAIAQSLGVTTRQVRIFRLNMGVSSFYKLRWEVAAAHLGAMPDKELAQLLGVTQAAVNKQRIKRTHPSTHISKKGIPTKAIELLGKVPDYIIAQEFGRSYETVRRWRYARGIPSVKAHRPWSDKELAQLGTMDDIQLGRLLMRKPSEVRKKRVALDIAPFAPCQPASKSPQNAENTP